MSRLKKLSKVFTEKINNDKLQQYFDNLLKDLSSLQVFYQQAKQLHWIAEGENYIAVHRFLDEVANKTLECVDLLAERITYLGVTPPADIDQILYRTYVEFGDIDDEFIQSEAMSALELSIDKLIENLKKSYNMAGELNDVGTEQLVQEIIFDLESLQHHIISFK